MEPPMDTTAIERVAANAAPGRLPVEGDPSAEERHWAVRLTADLPPGTNTVRLAEAATKAASEAVSEARLTRGLDPATEEGRISLRVHSVDTRHLIVSIRTVRLERDDAHAWLVAASAALRSLHEMTAIDDIQGLPRIFWRVLVGT
jgi:hypothetical protein